ncbi:MAG: LysE family transporter [Bacillota bacterium]
MEFIKGLALGLTLQLSVGPVFFAVLHKAAVEGSREAFKMTLGVAVVDACYIAVSFTGIAALLQVKALQSVILAAGAAVLVYFGLRYIRNAPAGNEELPAKPAQPARKIFLGGSFAYGLKLTAVNPLTIIFWSGTFGALLASRILAGPAEAALTAAGCVSATLLFLGLISFFGRFLPLRRNPRLSVICDCAVGAVLIIFGCIMVYKLVG